MLSTVLIDIYLILRDYSRKIILIEVSKRKRVNLASRGRFSALGDELTSGTIIARKTTVVRFSDRNLPIRELITTGDDEVPLSIAR